MRASARARQGAGRWREPAASPGHTRHAAGRCGAVVAGLRGWLVCPVLVAEGRSVRGREGGRREGRGLARWIYSLIPKRLGFRSGAKRSEEAGRTEPRGREEETRGRTGGCGWGANSCPNAGVVKNRKKPTTARPPHPAVTAQPEFDSDTPTTPTGRTEKRAPDARRAFVAKRPSPSHLSLGHFYHLALCERQN